MCINTYGSYTCEGIPGFEEENITICLDKKQKGTSSRKNVVTEGEKCKGDENVIAVSVCVCVCERGREREGR